jgi:hypothetical protein
VHFSFPLARTEAEFKEEHEVWDLILELTITSPNIIVDSEVQLSIPETTNAVECVFKYSKMKNGTTDRKRRVR